MVEQHVPHLLHRFSFLLHCEVGLAKVVKQYLLPVLKDLQVGVGNDVHLSQEPLPPDPRTAICQESQHEVITIGIGIVDQLLPIPLKQQTL